jgi:hypothetical protein
MPSISGIALSSVMVRAGWLGLAANSITEVQVECVLAKVCI